MISGIIKITNLVNEHIYIGYSFNVESRIIIIKSELKGGRHPNKQLQSDWDRLGENYFTIEVIEECPEIELVNRKQYYMDLLKPTYNVLEKSSKSNKYIQRSEIGLINIREASRKLQKDHKYRETMDRVYKDPAWLENIANKNKKIAKDPKWIKSHKDGIKNRPQSWRENNAKAARNRSQSWRENVTEAIKKTMAKKTSNDPNWRKNIGKKNSANPEWHKAVSDGLKKYYANRNSAKEDAQLTSTGVDLDSENHIKQ